MKGIFTDIANKVAWQASHSGLATILAAAALFFLCVYCFYLAFLHPLHDIPGPLLGKFSDLWKLLHMYRGDFSSSLGILHERHGYANGTCPFFSSNAPSADMPLPRLRCRLCTTYCNLLSPCSLCIYVR